MQQFTKLLKAEFHKTRNLIFVVFVFFMAAAFSFFATGDMDTSSAANPNNFKAGNIISDAVMGNYQSMSVAEIQAFLTSQNSCNNRNYNLYKEQSSRYPNISWHWTGSSTDGHFVCLSEERFGDGVTIGEGQTAAEIIYAASQQYKINPQVLIVLLEKEQGLISDTYPHSNQYRSATGYGCPDTAACNSEYYGFKNQVFRAAELFRYVLDHNSSYYPAGHNVYVRYNPSASCGGTNVYIENRATAALYQYTPYQPNAAALNAGYGIGNTCSAYGNRNFYFYFTDWFGSTQAAVDGELVTIPDGEYNLVPAVSDNRSLGLRGSNAELTNLDTTDKTQRWNIHRDTVTGYYQITNLSTNQPLIVQNTEPGMSTNVLAGASSTCSKNWKIYRTSDNYLTLESACAGGIVLDVYGGYTTASTNVQTHITNKTSAQKWSLVAGETLPDGIYTINSGITTTKAVDISGGSNRSGSNIQIWDNNKTIAQKWQILYNQSTHDYTITNPINGKALDVYDASMKNGSNIQLYSSNKTCAQRWQIIKQKPQEYIIMSSCDVNKVIDLSNASIVNRSNIQLWSYDPNTLAQRWQLILAPTVEDGEYTFVSKLIDEDRVIDLSSAKIANGTNIQLWKYDATTIAQRWQIEADIDGYYNIYTPDTSKNLDVYDASMKNGTNIHLFSFNNTCAQKWMILESGESTYTLFSACNTNYALDVSGGQTINGTNIQLWQYDQEANAQKWLLMPRQQASEPLN